MAFAAVFYKIDLANPDKKQAPGIKHYAGAHILSNRVKSDRKTGFESDDVKLIA